MVWTRPPMKLLLVMMMTPGHLRRFPWDLPCSRFRRPGRSFPNQSPPTAAGGRRSARTAPNCPRPSGRRPRRTWRWRRERCSPARPGTTGGCPSTPGRGGSRPSCGPGPWTTTTSDSGCGFRTMMRWRALLLLLPGAGRGRAGRDWRSWWWFVYWSIGLLCLPLCHWCGFDFRSR